MPNAFPPSVDPRRLRLDVRSLSLAQLQKLATQGSRRARAELESRMQTADAAASHTAPAAAPRPAPALRRPSAVIPTLTERATAASDRAGASATPAAPGPHLPHQDLAAQFELLARQDAQRARAADLPRLIGMMLIVWGALVLLGAAVMLAHGGGFYYLFCALGVAAVGWLLLRCSRWALPVHGALLLATLAWAWYSSHGSPIMMLVQAMPLLVPAAWMAVPAVRQPLVS